MCKLNVNIVVLELPKELGSFPNNLQDLGDSIQESGP